MKPGPIPENESERIAILRQYDILDTAEEDDFNDIVQLASQICETPISLITLVDTHRQWFKARKGLAVSETPREFAFCGHALQKDEILLVPDTSKDDRFFDNPLVKDDPNIGFYAGMPIITETGHTLGTLCVIDQKPRNLSEVQLSSLRALGKQVARLLELRLKVIRLENSRKALKESESQIKAIFHNTIDAVVVMTDEGIIREWNAKAEIIFGWKAEEVVGKTLADIIIPERFRKAHENGMKNYLETGISKILNKNIEISALCKNNTEIDVALGISTFTVNDKHLFIGFISDITERKSIAEKMDRQKVFYETILNSLPTDIAVFDANHRYLFVNPGAIKNDEYREFIIGKDDFEYCTYRNRDMAVAENRRKQFIQVKQTRQPLEWEDDLADPTGRVITHLRKMFPVYNQKDELDMIIGFGIDITERREAEIELIKAKDLAEQLTNSKDQFLANMSHEIRTPMNAILGMSQQLAKTGLDTKQQFYNETITKAAENLLIIINDILDFSKIEAGKLSLENIGFNIAEVIEKAIRVLNYKAEEKGISVTASLHNQKLSPVLMGDPYRINQVLLNLINNAIKFTEKGGVTISCELTGETITTQKISIKVSDTGIGMDKDFVDRIFEKFTQEDVSVTRRYGGTGLGLSISKELVALMGGHIRVESVKNSGTSISFELELKKGTQADMAVAESVIIDPGMLADKKILVVDDNEMNRLVATTILNNYGAIVLEAPNGQACIDYLHADKIDLILMDIQMPVMDGIEATKLIRKDISKTLPIVALTANAIKGANEKYLSVGMNDYLSKPFAEFDLIKICAIWLGKKINFSETEKAEIMSNDNLYDLSYLNEISRGDNDFLKKMIELFIEQIPASILAMQTAYTNGDLAAVKALAHRTKSSIDTLLIKTLHSEIREIEALAADGQAGARMEELLQRLAEIIPKVIEQLKQII